MTINDPFFFLYCTSFQQALGSTSINDYNIMHYLSEKSSVISCYVYACDRGAKLHRHFIFFFYLIINQSISGFKSLIFVFCQYQVCRTWKKYYIYKYLHIYTSTSSKTTEHNPYLTPCHIIIYT